MNPLRTLSSCVPVVVCLASAIGALSPLRGESLDLVNKKWPAAWISPKGAALEQDNLVHYRREFSLTTVPEHFVVHVTADMRYRLWVNGEPVGQGPQRGDFAHWKYDTFDLASKLRPGKNVIAAQVVHHRQAATAYFHQWTGFLLQGEGAALGVVDTGPEWKVLRDSGYTTIPTSAADLRTYIVSGPGDAWDGAAYPWGWETAEGGGTGWSEPLLMGNGEPLGVGTDMVRMLVPRNLPAMEEVPVRWKEARRVSGISLPTEFPASPAPFSVPAHSTVTVLLDQGAEINAFPELVLSGGKGAQVELAYAEALFDKNRTKGNRNEVEGRTLIGVMDRFVADGGAKRLYSTVDFRCYRYAELRIVTGAEPLVVEDLRARKTGYPFKENARFETDDPSLAALWDTGWRTARACAYETYMDCPYYERLQYVGDTRIQALISLYVSGDDRLMRQALEAYDQSRISEGITQSRYPSAVPQLINTFSLFWVDMVWDFSRLRDDAAFVGARLDGVEAVLRWFERRIDPKTGLMGPLPYWTFVDWTNEWPWDQSLGSGGEAPGARTGGSVIVTLQYAVTLEHAAQLMEQQSRPELAAHYRTTAAKLKAAAKEKAWDAGRHYFTDTPGGATTSQHVNALAVLAGAVDPAETQDLMRRVVASSGMVRSSLYFRFYVLRAMREAGLGDNYLAELGDWHAMVADGLTTFAEKTGETRSDCHAWSASPVYEFLATVAGIEPASPGFKSVVIQPHLGKLRQLKASMPHPQGEISVWYHLDCGVWKAKVELPAGVAGTFVHGPKQVLLHGGVNEFDF